MQNVKIKILTLMLGLSMTGLVVLGAIFWFFPIKIESRKIVNFHSADPSDKDVYETVYSFKSQAIDLQNKQIIGGIIPHHFLAGDLIAEFFKNLATQADEIETVILIGPNHFNAGEGRIITSGEDWQTPYGVLQIDHDLSSKILDKQEITVEEDVFNKEHAINAEVGFIKKSLPQAKFIPLILRSSFTEDEAGSLAEFLFENTKDKKTVILVSADFSHYKDSQTAQQDDKNSLNILNHFKFDKAYDMAVDSPGSIYTLLRYAVLKNSEFLFLNNSNSALLAKNNGIKNTTSYITGFFVEKNAVAEQKRSVKMLFFGDLMVDRYLREEIEKKGFSNILKNFSHSDYGLPQNYDLVGANLEGVITNEGEHYQPDLIFDFAFKPEWFQELKEYNFNFFNLSNNHLSDQGARGIMETRKNLNFLGFLYAGCEDRKVADCSATSTEISGTKIGLAGFSMVYGLFDEEKALARIKELKKIDDLVIVNVHWGVEYEHQFNRVQQDLAHKMIDAGADIIVGHHPHVVQGMEIYNNRPIFYSLGNFIFDQYFSQDTQEGLAVGLDLTPSDLKVDLIPFQLTGKQIEWLTSEEKNTFFKKIITWSNFSDNQNEIKEELIIKINEN